MAAILKKAYQGYHILFEDIVDPRTKSWLLVAKPYQGLALVALYLMFVLKWGPDWMKNRKPFNLDKILIIYNALQILFCGYIFYGAVWFAWGGTYKWVCEPVNFSEDPNAIRIARFVHYYFLCKVIDLLDTVFFVLRKKFNQVSFLHVYHHTGMVLLTWGATTYFPGGHGTLVGAINSFVHVVMYGYYLLTVIKPIYKQSVWWKKYITQLQILQFFWCVVHMAIPVFKSDCDYPRWTAALFLPQNIFMLILFIDFYIKAYVKKPKVAVRVEVHTNGSKQNGYTKQYGHAEENGHAKEKGFEIPKIHLNGNEKENTKGVKQNKSINYDSVCNDDVDIKEDKGLRKREMHSETNTH